MTPSFQKALATLRERFIDDLAEDEQQLAADLSRLGKGPLDNDALHQLGRRAHRLKGAGGTLGFSDLSRVASALQDAVDSVSIDDDADDILETGTSLLKAVSELRRALGINQREADRRE